MESPEPVAVDRRHYGGQLRILVADDDRDTVETLSFILRDEGYIVTPVYTGTDALSLARVFRPDVIVHDIAVPGLSGYAVAQTIRYAFPDLRRPLMIAISGVWKQMPDKKVAQQMGFDEFLIKPCDPAALLGVIESFKRSRTSPSPA